MVASRVANQHQCHRCGKVFTSMMRLQHHRAAKHAPRTSADIPRTSQIMARTRHQKARGSGTHTAQR